MGNPSDRHRSRVGQLRRELHICLREAIEMAPKCKTDQDKAQLLDELLKRTKELITKSDTKSSGASK